MLDAVEVKVEIVGVALGPAELPAVVGEHRPDRQVEVAVERQDVVVQHRHGGLGLLGDMEEPKGVGAEGVHDRVQVDPADAFEAADEEGVGREQLARRRTLDMPLPEAGVELFQEGGLLGGDGNRLSGVRGLQRSMRVPRPLSLRIFWMVIAETRTPSSAKVASWPLQP